MALSGESSVPDADAVMAHVEAWMPRPRNRLAAVGPAIALAVAVGAAVLLLPIGYAAVVPWLAIGGVLGWLAMRRYRASRAQRSVGTTYELTALRRPAEAIDAAWEALPHVQRFPELHVRAVMLLGANLMHARAFDAALRTQDYLLAHVPKQHPAGLMTRLYRTLALLRDDRLADADAELRSLRRASLPPEGKAVWRLAELYQQVKTNNFDEARDQLNEGGVMEALRPLGVDAAVGYALAAVVYDAAGEDGAADAWWRRATMLIEPDGLCAEVPEAAVLRDRAPARSLAVAMGEDGLE